VHRQDVAGRPDEATAARDSAADPATTLGIIAVAEGDVEPTTESLKPESIAQLAARIDRLRSDEDARHALAGRALAGAVAGIAPLLEEIADDCAFEATDAEALLRSAELEFEKELISLRTELGKAAFLREEALRQWQEFVGADQITRLFSRGIGQVRGALASLVRPARAPVAEIRSATTDDLVAVARLHAAEAARRTAADWDDDPAVRDGIATDPSLWATSIDFDDRVRRRLNAWIDGIADDIRATGRPKRLLARGASVGVNALGTGVMLGTFIHTGGLTGAEVGVAAATAFVNQKLLGALFGEAAMSELIGNARRRLDQVLAATMAEERARFEQLLPPPSELRTLAGELREAADRARAMPNPPAAAPPPAQPAEPAASRMG
jgi:hypothetical protein